MTEDQQGSNPAASGGGLVAQVLTEFIKRLRQEIPKEDAVIEAVEKLAGEGKLKDSGAIQDVLLAAGHPNETA